MNLKLTETNTNGFSFLLSGTFNEFDPRWFKNVGATIVKNTTFIHIFYFFWDFFVIFSRA